MASLMMSKTSAPVTPPPSESSSAHRSVSIRANLLPTEVVAARSTDRMRRRVLTGLAALLVVLVAGFALSWLQTQSANSDLADAQHAGQALVGQQQQFHDVVDAQNKANSVRTQLQSVMTGDLPWSTLLGALRSQAPAGVAVSSVTGSIAATTGTAAGSSQTSTTNPLNLSGKAAVGTLTITGTASSQNAAAAYGDNLSKIKGLAAATITTVSTSAAGIAFSASAVITTDALDGRFARPTTPSTPGGK